MAHIGIVGGGNLGANTAFFLGERSVADVLMYDNREGLSTGKSLDLMEAAPVRRYRVSIQGTDDPNDLKACKVVIIAAGEVRRPGEQRSDLFARNKEIAIEYAELLSGSKAVVIIATEPVDALTALFTQKSGLPPERVIGIGTGLDRSRLRYLISEETGLLSEDINAAVIGSHDEHMVPLRRYTRVAGVPIDVLVGLERWEELVAQLRMAGDRIIGLSQRSSAFYGPADALAELAEAVVRDQRRILPVSTLLNGHYGLKDTAVSLPAIIGAQGVVRMLSPELDEQEKALLQAGAQGVAATLAS
ncbi:MAG: malate dehydrogenase [Spirochaeta sp.]|nr:malate dehydrogenase [Spirochaeta sp.]